MRECSIEGCSRPSNAREWCTLHYQRWSKHGDPTYWRPRVPEVKTCTQCGHSGPTAVDFPPKKRVCRPCTAANKKAWADANPARVRASRERGAAANAIREMRRKAVRKGLDPDEVAAYRAQHDGRCDICEEIPVRVLNEDHCHTTGRFRGLICTSCNNGLGRFRDDPKRLQAAIDFLLNPPADIGVSPADLYRLDVSRN